MFLLSLPCRRKNFSTYGTDSVGIDEEEFMTKSLEVLNSLSCIDFSCNQLEGYVPEELGSMNPLLCLVY